MNAGFTPHNVISAREGAFERIPDHGTADFGQTGYIVVGTSA